MTIQYSTTVRNAFLDSEEATIGTSAKIQIRVGAQPANCAAARTGLLLIEYALASDWGLAASGGSKTLANLPISGTATGGAPDNAGYYSILDSTGTTCHEQGSITITGGGGDMTIDNLSIANGQTVIITGFTKTFPGA